MSDFSSLPGDVSATSPSLRIHGMVLGIVTSNEDPEHLGRVQVWFPRIAKPGASHWARIAAPMAGPECGMYFVPAVGDQVLVMFESGMIDRPYVLGVLWNETDAPPSEGLAGHPDVRVIKSRRGHVVILDDTEGAEKVELRSHGGHTIVLDDTAGSEKVMLRGADGETSVVLDSADGSIDLVPGSGGQVRIGGASASKTLAVHEEVVDLLTEIQTIFQTLVSAWGAVPCASPAWNAEGVALKAVWSGAVATSLGTLSAKLQALSGSAKGRSS